MSGAMLRFATEGDLFEFLSKVNYDEGIEADFSGYDQRGCPVFVWLVEEGGDSVHARAASLDMDRPEAPALVEGDLDGLAYPVSLTDRADRPKPEMVGDGCECWVTPENTWLSAASLGYGSGYEPGSQVEYNPDCPQHGTGPTEDEVLDSIAACTNPVTRLPKWLQAPALGRDFRPIHAMVVEAIRERYHLVPKEES